MNLSVLNCTWDELQKIIAADKKMNEQGDDATWILTSAFIIFTMQSGFGLLEAGSATSKNEANIMMKNAIDVIFGGLSYWICGFAFSFGNNGYQGSLTAFMGVGDFFTGTIDHVKDYGDLYSKYFFQLSFATTATTIVSGAMAERTNLKAYIVFSFVNTFSYVFPAHWIWDNRGFLFKLGVVDVAGCGPVHMVGGVSALISTLFLKPRSGIFDEDAESPKMASPTNMLLGTFMLWWGWLGFNCGSTFGVSGIKWKLASRTAVLTINGSIGGGLWAILYSYKITKLYKGKLDIPTFVSGVLGGLVSITAICSVCQPWLGFIIGFIGGIISSYGMRLLVKLKIDDPVACIPVHFFCSVWGLIAVGLVGEKELEHGLSKHSGIFYGGPFSFLCYQILACIIIITWSAVTTALQLFLTDAIVGLRMTYEEEMIGADEVEHGIKQTEKFVATGSCTKCSAKHDSIIIRSPTVIVNKTYARKIYNGDQGIINFGFSSSSVKRNDTNNNSNNVSHPHVHGPRGMLEVSEENEDEGMEIISADVLKEELKEGNGIALISSKKIVDAGHSRYAS